MDLVTTIGFAPGPGVAAVARDQIVVSPTLGLLAVADSSSGEADGRAGARLALELVRSHLERNVDVLQRFRRTPTQELRLAVLEAIEEGFARASQDLFAFARRKRDVLVTMDVLLLLGTEAFIGHVGDGRVYLVRRGLVHQLTVDHSRGDEVLQFEEEISPAQGSRVQGSRGGADRPSTRALGPTPRVRVESLCTELAAEDRFVVCAAGLHAVVPETILHARFISEHLSQLGGALASDAGSHPLLAAAAQLGSGEPFTPDSAQARLAILAPMPLFTHCTERELRIVAQATNPRTFPAGAVLFEEGQPGNEVFLVISGLVDVVKGGKVIAQLGPGSTLGEMAMLDEPVRSAMARTLDQTELMVITRQSFFAMLRANPMLAVKILWNLNLRLSASLRQTSARLAELENKLQQSQS
jgi:serine/threonine protein phosphatase PrpC